MQREENHEDHQQQGFEQCVVDLPDRLRDVGGHVERYLVGDAFGEAAADLLHRLAHRARHLHGVGARQHVDVEHRGISPVDTALGAVRRGFERDARHVAQADERSVGVGADDDLLEFAHRRKASAGGDRDRDVEVRDGLLAQYARRRFAVLVLDLEHAGDIYAQCGDMEGALKYWKMAQEKGGDVSQLLKKKIQLKKYIEE